MSDAMPDQLYACPRGSGTASGVWTDLPCGDEPETKYLRADLFTEMREALNSVSGLINYLATTAEPNDEYDEMIGTKLPEINQKIIALLARGVA